MLTEFKLTEGFEETDNDFDDWELEEDELEEPDLEDSDDDDDYIPEEDWDTED